MIVSLDNTENILDESIILEDNFTPIISIPIVENSRLGCNIVSYNDINEISKAYDCLDEDAYMAICIANGIDPDNLAVSINESDVLLDPEIVKPFSDRFVINPIVVDEATDFIVDYLINEAYENNNEEYLDYLLEDTYEVLNEILDNIPAGQRAAIRKMILAKKKRDMTAAEWNFAANPHNNFNTRQAAHDYWKKTGRSSSGAESMIRNAFKQNAANRPAPTPTPSPTPQPSPNGEQAAKDYLLKKSHAKWSARRDAILKRRKTINTAKKYTGPAAFAGLGVGIGAAAAYQMRKIKALKNKLSSLEGQLETAPPERKGIIRRMIDRIKAIIQSILNKVRGN